MRFRKQSLISKQSVDDGTFSFTESLFASKRETEERVDSVNRGSPGDLLKELDSIFEENRRWLEERKEREKLIMGIINSK